jgi:hypothetical protein
MMPSRGGQGSASAATWQARTAPVTSGFSSYRYGQQTTAQPGPVVGASATVPQK